MRSVFLATTAILVASAFSTSAQAQALNFDVAGQPLLFTGSGVGSGLAIGSSRTYSNVITINGTAIDAKITLTGLSSATLSDFDSTANPYAETAFFQPSLNISSAGGSATFHVEFFANGQPVTLRNFYVNTYDLDGSGASAAGRQFTDFAGFASYQLSSTTSVRMQSTGGGTRFVTTVGGNVTASVGTPQFNDIRARVFYSSASSLNISIGDTSATGIAYFGLDFSVGYAFGNAAVDTTAPVLSSGQTLSYNENRAAAALIGNVAATDNIGVVNYRFGATNTQTSADGFYTIDNTGAVRITAAGAAAGSAHNDFEIAPNSHVYAIQAADSGGNWSSAQNVTFSELDIDDLAPAIPTGQNLAYSENHAASAPIATVAAADNTAVTAFRFENSGTQTSANGFYSINNAGVIQLTAAGAAAGAATNDFEIAPNSFTLAIEAGDASGNWSPAVDVTLVVADLDDNAPTVSPRQSFSYAENQLANAQVASVVATDASGVTGFRFTATNAQVSADGYYTIDNAGVIRLTAAGAVAGVASNDFEIAPNNFVYGVQAGDASGNWSASENVGLNVTNIDDSAPVLTSGQNLAYAENRSTGDLIGAVAAVDDSGVTGFRFTATGTATSADGYYVIDNNGALHITAAGVANGVANNDFEVAPNSFNYGVQAGDAAGNWSTSVNVTVSVTDLDDTAPKIGAGQSFSYAENQAANTAVGTVAGSDDTAVTAFRFAATGTQVSADGNYSIDNAGVIRLTAGGVAAEAATNDYETAPNAFTYGVEAGDAAGLWSPAVNVTLNVTDVSEGPVNAAPSIAAGQTFVYAENRGANTIVGTVAASDDAGVTSFRFAATGTQTSADGYFSIDNGGVVTLTVSGAAAGIAANDYEVAPNSFSHAVNACDIAGLWSTATNVTFQLSDLDDTAPLITAGQSFAYAENQVADAVIGAVTASDGVGVVAFRFAATGGPTSADGLYKIDNNGVLRITAAGIAAGIANNDHEVAPNSFSYDIEAGDGAGNWSAPASMALNVTDLADTPPVLSGPGGSTGATASISVAEGTTAVATLAANMPISSWSIIGGDDQGRFEIDGSGTITFVAAPDYEAPADAGTNNSYVLTVQATDPNGLTTTQTITVTVTDVADTPPVITGPGGSTGANASIDVPEGTSTVTRLTTNVPVSGWAIIGGNDQGRFAIDTSGTITFVAAPDYEAPSDSDANNSYVLTVQATDSNGLTTSQTITVKVTDLADTRPAITGPSGGAGAAASAISVNEGTSAVTTLNANVPVTWSIVDGNDLGQFAISAAGALTFVSAPNYEAPADSDRNNSYVLVVRAADANGNVAEQTITVSVLNVDELQQKLNEIGGNLRGDLRNQAFSSLTTMLSFNESLLGVGDVCSDAGARKPLSGGLNADELHQDAKVRYSRDFSSCESRTRVLVDGGVGFSRVQHNWTARGLGSLRVEHRVGSATVLGAALIGSGSSDELASFATSRISDHSLQLNVYGKTKLAENLRFAAFAGWGRSWYSFKLKDAGLDLHGNAYGTRKLYGATLSGDINLAGLSITTDAILSRAEERLGSTRLDASYLGEDRSDILFGLGKVDVTRLSVPVHVPIAFRSPQDGREPTRLEFSPGLLCQDTAQDSSALDCGYQLTMKFSLAPTVRSMIQAEARTEAVDGYLLHSFTLGYQRRFGSYRQLSWGMDVARQARGQQADNRVMVRLGLER